MILDLSGFMFSGKASVSDLLSEFDNIYVPNNRDEFDLLRVGGGLIDLKNAVDDWSPIRTYSAINRFKKTVGRISRQVDFSNSFLNLGWGYSNRFPNIDEYTNQFISEIIELEWDTPWPYSSLEYDAVQIFNTRINDFSKSKWALIRAVVGIIDNIYNKIVVRNIFDYNKTGVESYNLSVNIEKFINSAQKYVNNILWDGVDRETFEVLVTHNALEPFNPAKNLNLLGANSKCIVVSRDPRDVYATAMSFQVGFNDNVEFYKKIIGADDLHVFIKRFNAYKEKIVENSDVLRLNFNDLILNYDVELDKICEFIGIDSSHHINRFKAFNPEISKKNLYMWEKPEFSYLQNHFEIIHSEC